MTDLAALSTKRCIRCRESKALDEFYAHSETKDGRQSYCIPCQKAYVREWTARQPGGATGYTATRRLTRRFGGVRVSTETELREALRSPYPFYAEAR